MKKVMLFGILAVIFIFAVSSFAQTPWPDRSGTKAEKEKVLKAEPAPAFKFSLNNLSGDFGVIFESGVNSSVALGVGLDIVNYREGLVTLRAQAFFPSQAILAENDASVVGAALMVNLIKLAGLVPGTSWLATAINPSVGLFGGYDFVSGKLAAGPMISIINIPF